MIIDFHTHVFPDKIANKTIELLSAKGGFTAQSDGTVAGLIRKMEEAGVDLSVILPVMTSPTQFESINSFAAQVNNRFRNKERRLISFAGIHPCCEDLAGKMEWIASQGFLGIKIHPDYQCTYIDDERYISIIKAAKLYDLIVVTHSGVDAGYRDADVRCTPKRVRRVIEEIGHSKLVLAHYGASELLDEVYDTLAGLDVYFDTANTLAYIDELTFKKILEKHGADRILFATDSPWSSIENDVNTIRSFSLDKNTEDKIFSQNARKLLGI